MTTDHSERAVIRLLLKYGSLEFERKVRIEDGSEEVTTVLDYIVREIVSDDLYFDNLLYAKIFDEFRFASEQGFFTDDKQFIKHQDPAISSLSADLLSEHYILSRIWKEKQAYVATEEEKVKDLVPDTVLKFKGDKIKVRLKDIMTQLEAAVKAGDTERVLVLQKKDQSLKVALRMISEKLGKRIIL